MTSADWAAWVSAFGGVLSVAATGFVAVHQTRRADKLEDEAMELERVRRNALITEAQRVSTQIVGLHQMCVKRVRPSDEFSGWVYAYEEYRQAIDIECDRLMTLLQFAATNVGIYTTIERIARTSRIQPRTHETSQGMAGLASHRIAEQTTKLAEELDRYR